MSCTCVVFGTQYTIHTGVYTGTLLYKLKYICTTYTGGPHDIMREQQQ